LGWKPVDQLRRKSNDGEAADNVLVVVDNHDDLTAGAEHRQEFALDLQGRPAIVVGS
jgi:hypothetical protein